jgi:hypothetical protein
VLLVLLVLVLLMMLRRMSSMSRPWTTPLDQWKTLAMCPCKGRRARQVKDKR